MIADEINANTDFPKHKNQKIPLFEKAEDYDTRYRAPSEQEKSRHHKKLSELMRKRDRGEITQEEYDKEVNKEYKRFHKLKYPNPLLYACSGLGDNEAVITIERDKGAFRLNIGNNDIHPNTTGWIEKVLDMGIRVEEAETCSELDRYARDCTCGIVFFGTDIKIDENKAIEE